MYATTSFNSHDAKLKTTTTYDRINLHIESGELYIAMTIEEATAVAEALWKAIGDLKYKQARAEQDKREAAPVEAP